MQSFYVKKDIGKLHYLQVGSGEIVMVCFPGFGQSAHTFSRLLSFSIRKHYTFYIVDMFYEGGSVLYKDEILTQESWRSYINEIIKRHDIQQFTVLAYSIGARMALCLPNLTNLILIAPDGIKNRFIYRLIANNQKVGECLIWLSLKLNTVTKINATLRKWTNPMFVYKIAKIWRSLSLLPNLEIDVPTLVYIGSKDIVAHNKEIRKWVGQSEKRELVELSKGHFPLLVTVLRTRV